MSYFDSPASGSKPSTNLPSPRRVVGEVGEPSSSRIPEQEEAMASRDSRPVVEEVGGEPSSSRTPKQEVARAPRYYRPVVEEVGESSIPHHFRRKAKTPNPRRFEEVVDPVAARFPKQEKPRSPSPPYQGKGKQVMRPSSHRLGKQVVRPSYSRHHGKQVARPSSYRLGRQVARPSSRSLRKQPERPYSLYSSNRLGKQVARASDVTQADDTPPSSSGSAAPLVSVKLASNKPDKVPYRLQPVRTVPPWAKSVNEEFKNEPAPKSSKVRAPPRALAPQLPNSIPQEPQRRCYYEGCTCRDVDPSLGPPQPVPNRISHFFRHGTSTRHGRIWDHLRSDEPVIIPRFEVRPTESRYKWHDFMKSTGFIWQWTGKSNIASKEFFESMFPNLNRKSAVELDQGRPRRLSRSGIQGPAYKRLWAMALRHWLSPLLFRLTVMITSIIALGVAARIYIEEEKAEQRGAESAQSIFAIVVDVVAIPYSAYMTHDEYTGKPLGLRSASNKMCFILLDLFFIVFKAASTALGFEALVYQTITLPTIRKLAIAMAVFMLVGLISWTLNLAVNIFRVIEKLGGRRKASEKDEKTP